MDKATTTRNVLAAERGGAFRRAADTVEAIRSLADGLPSPASPRAGLDETDTARLLRDAVGHVEALLRSMRDDLDRGLAADKALRVLESVIGEVKS